MKKERGPQATKNTRPMAGTVGASRAFSVRQVMTVRNGKTAAETDRSRGEARQRDFITAYSSIMVGFYEPRTTNNGLSLGFRCGVPPRQIHEMNAVRRWPVAVRKKKAPDWGIFYETRVTRGDVVLLSLLPQSGI